MHKKASKNIWSRITLDNLVTVIASLGDRTSDLKEETWRLNSVTESSSSLWREVIDKLQLDHIENTRHALYDQLHAKHRDMDSLINRTRMEQNVKTNGDDASYIKKDEEENENFVLSSNPSLPLTQPPRTRAETARTVCSQNEKRPFIKDISLVLTASEWEDAFSRTDQKMKPHWGNLLYKNFRNTDVTCSLRFRTPHIKIGKRKRNCRFFGCFAFCSRKYCRRMYQIVLQQQTEERSSAVFLVKIFGEEIHLPNDIGARSLTGEDRDLVGKTFYRLDQRPIFKRHFHYR